MKTRALISIFIFVLASLLISGCATAPTTKEEREGVQLEVFFQSVKSGDYAEVKRLIKKGADVNAQDDLGFTALMEASWHGHTEVAKLLIEAGADVNTKSYYGDTALKWALGGEDPVITLQIVNLLIEAEAEITEEEYNEILYLRRMLEAKKYKKY